MAMKIKVRVGVEVFCYGKHAIPKWVQTNGFDAFIRHECVNHGDWIIGDAGGPFDVIEHSTFVRMFEVCTDDAE